MKLMGVSNTMSASYSQTTAASVWNDTTQANRAVLETPPMLSTPIRALWVDCVVLCHVLAQGLTGTARIDTLQFLRKMLVLATLHPRSAKAAGGVRVAALDLVTGLLHHQPNDNTIKTNANNNNSNNTVQRNSPTLAKTLAPWSLETLQTCLRALRSAGNGEPTYRVAAVRTACATVVACRNAFLPTRMGSSLIDSDTATATDRLVLPGAMEDKAVLEAVKVCKQAVLDKFPEVRAHAGILASLLTPLLVTNLPPSSSAHGIDGRLHALEDLLQLAYKHLDDESPETATHWAETLARGVATAIQFHQAEKDTGDGPKGGVDQGAIPRFGSRKVLGIAHSCTSLKNAVRYWIAQFVKVGGELVAPRLGGSYATGGRAVRIGISMVLTKILRLQVVLGAVGEDRSASLKEILDLILNGLGPDLEKQLRPPDTPASGPANPLFGATRTWSKNDAGLARLALSRVLREGLSEVTPEPTQINFLHELILCLPGKGDAESNEAPAVQWNANQLQIVLVEISHLLAALGEAAASRIEDAVIRLEICLEHMDQGVRHEAAIACASLTASFPTEGRKLVRSSIDEMQLHHAQLATLASNSSDAKEEPDAGIRMFRRPKEKEHDPSARHQCAIHGRALMISILVRDLTSLPGGLPTELLSAALSVAEIMLSCQFHEPIIQANAMSACNCVKAGFAIISGVLANGPKAAAPSVSLIFNSWQKAISSITGGGKILSPRHELLCVDAMLSSVVVFLKYCSELLLSVPEALTQVTVLLENVLPMLLPDGTFGSLPFSAPVMARLESSRSSLLEAFAWLPSGSFPMVADTVFSFAAEHIRAAVEGEVSCSILHALVSREDSILDAKTMSRARRDGQIGGARDLEETILLLTGEIAHPGEREAVLHLSMYNRSEPDPSVFRGSRILGICAKDASGEKPPTPLHGVGTWRKPIDPSCSSKVRLVDAAIQAFSATFGLKSGSEQQGAMDMLESLVPPLLAQLARAIGVNSALVDQSPRSKAKEDSSAVANITAVLLSCLKALPLHETSHNVPLGLGPPWMNKAKDLLLTVLPSPSSTVRRAAAEGLALLATLGVSEDAHFLQSKVLHSLDEVMQGNKPDGKPRAIALEPVSAARAGSLLTLACIQRTAFNVAKKQIARARSRVNNSKDVESRRASELPLLQMMTRILPSIACSGFRDFFVVRTYALHSFSVLLIYSERLEKTTDLDKGDKQLLRKAVELVEDNFAASMTISSTEMDRGQEAEKMTSEVAFLSVLLRLMSFLVQTVYHLQDEDPGIGERFILIARLTLELYGSHPVVFTEAMAFFEVTAGHRQLIPLPWDKVDYTESPLFASISSIQSSLAPIRPALFAFAPWEQPRNLSAINIRASGIALQSLTQSNVSVVDWCSFSIVSALFASLESTSGKGFFGRTTFLRSLAVPRHTEVSFHEWKNVELDLTDTIRTIFYLNSAKTAVSSSNVLRWILFARALLVKSGPLDYTDKDEEVSIDSVVQAASRRSHQDVSLVYTASSAVRWQVKCIAAQIVEFALDALLQNTPENAEVVYGDAKDQCAKELEKAKKNDSGLPDSRLVFHLQEILSAVCMSTVAVVDQAEVHSLQVSAMYALTMLILAFAESPDPELPQSRILDQYAQQIFSAVKHGLELSTSSPSTACVQLYVASCYSMSALVESGVTKDPMVLKRLLRPIVPRSDETPLFMHSEPYPAELTKISEEGVHENRRVRHLKKIAQVWCTSKLLIGNEPLSEYILLVSKDLIKDPLHIAVHSAAFAFDGARLLISSHFSLTGACPCYRTSEADEKMACERGFLFECADDIDDSTKTLLMSQWSYCASTAIKPLVSSMDSENGKFKVLCDGWITVLTPLLLEGVHHGLLACTSGINLPCMDATNVTVDCLRGLSCLTEAGPEVLCKTQHLSDVERLLRAMLQKVWLPTLRNEKLTVDSKIAKEMCRLVRSLADLMPFIASDESTLLVTVLTPLELLERAMFDCEISAVADEIVSTCLDGMTKFIAHGKVSESLLEAMLHLLLQRILVSESSLSEQTTESSKVLLKQCFSSGMVNTRRRNTIAADLAHVGNWDTWLVVFASDDGSSSWKSLDAVSECLQTPGGPQMALLAKLCAFAQGCPISSPLLQLLLHRVGADVVGTLYLYGTLQIPGSARLHRQKACADALKLSLIGYQQVVATKSDDRIAQYLSLLFETIVAVLRYNGVPNHPSPQHESDPALGRMSAQAILMTARTTPVAFKTTVSELVNEQDRPLLEFAVRAEMNGYVNPNQAPVKKKISLQGFKK
jgi:hypothetical protein